MVSETTLQTPSDITAITTQRTRQPTRTTKTTPLTSPTPLQQQPPPHCYRTRQFADDGMRGGSLQLSRAVSFMCVAFITVIHFTSHSLELVSASYLLTGYLESTSLVAFSQHFQRHSLSLTPAFIRITLISYVL